MLTKRLDGLRDGGGLLADRHVDALQARPCPSSGSGSCRCDGGLAGLAVADDELALTAADRRHRVDGRDAGVAAARARACAGDDGRPGSRGRAGGQRDRALAVEGPAQTTFTTRPSGLSPTGMERIRPRLLDRAAPPSRRTSPSTRQPMLFSFRLRRRPGPRRPRTRGARSPRRWEPDDAGDAVADLEHTADLLAVDRGVHPSTFLRSAAMLAGIDRQVRALRSAPSTVRR